MALSVTGTPAAANATSIALPAHAAGDLIVIAAWRSASNTVPGKPAAGGTVPTWADIDATNGTNACAMRTAAVVATANNHTSGTWSSASSLAVIVIRGVAPAIGDHARQGWSQTNAPAPALSLQDPSGAAIILRFHAHSVAGTWPTAPAGHTRQAAATNGLCLNMKTVTTTCPVISQNTQTGTTGKSQGASIEIRESSGGAGATGNMLVFF